MGALVSLRERQLDVVPGSSTTLTVSVKNTGTVVDQFTIDVLGDPGAFATAAPAALSLFPGTEGSAVVTFLDVHGTCNNCWYCLVAKASTRCPSRKVYGITYGAEDGLLGGWSERIYLRPGVRIVPLRIPLPSEPRLSV